MPSHCQPSVPVGSTAKSGGCEATTQTAKECELPDPCRQQHSYTALDGRQQRHSHKTVQLPDVGKYNKHVTTAAHAASMKPLQGVQVLPARLQFEPPESEHCAMQSQTHNPQEPLADNPWTYVTLSAVSKPLIPHSSPPRCQCSAGLASKPHKRGPVKTACTKPVLHICYMPHTATHSITQEHIWHQ